MERHQSNMPKYLLDIWKYANPPSSKQQWCLNSIQKSAHWSQNSPKGSTTKKEKGKRDFRRNKYSWLLLHSFHLRGNI